MSRELDLTPAQRVLLANQLKILEALYPDEADHYGQWRDAVESGYTIHYDQGAEWLVTEEMTEQECMEVRDILTMFCDLKHSVAESKDTSGIDLNAVGFRGFSGNEECRYLGYADFLINKTHRWQPLSDSGDGLNSHFPFLDAYRRMLAVWRKYHPTPRLTKEQIQEITAAAIHPSNRKPAPLPTA